LKGFFKVRTENVVIVNLGDDFIQANPLSLTEGYTGEQKAKSHGKCMN
jgi:hypothetical protein